MPDLSERNKIEESKILHSNLIMVQEEAIRIIDYATNDRAFCKKLFEDEQTQAKTNESELDRQLKK